MTDSDHRSLLESSLGPGTSIELLLEKAQEPKHPLHGFFEWDDTKAVDAYDKLPKDDEELLWSATFPGTQAEDYREIQARRLLLKAGYHPKYLIQMGYKETGGMWSLSSRKR